MARPNDPAHRATDAEIARLSRRVSAVYREAQRDVKAKLTVFNRKFKIKDKKYRQQLKAGEITQEQYQAWLKGQVFQGRQWQAKLDQVTQTLTHADEVAQKIINGSVYGVFSNNANWMSYSLEHGAGLDFGFELYDPSTVARLLRDQPELLPMYRLDIPKDQQWNQHQITRQITQGIIQGEDIFKIADRMAKVTDRDKNLCLTRARTAMTGAQNAGRQESLTRANKMGIETEKEWLATLDGHTRTQHARLDGQHVPVDQMFKIDQYEIEYPGDPHAHPAMVYNCRCTMIGRIKKHPPRDAQRYDNIDGKPIADMTYMEWMEAKRKKQPIPERPVKKPVETIKKSRPNAPGPAKKSGGQNDRSRTPKPESAQPETLRTDYTIKELEGMSRSRLIKIAKEVARKRAASQGISEAEALRRFQLLVDSNTTPQLRKYIHKYGR